MHDLNFIHFSMHKNGPQITHLAYADDIIIFSSGNSKSIKLVMKQIRNYEISSGKIVNKDKGFFLVGPKSCAYRINRIRNKTGFLDKSFPFTYLGCPIYIYRKRLSYFDNMTAKIIERLSGWQGNMLPCGGKMYPVSKKWCTSNSQAWKYLLWARDKCKNQIIWKINDGQCYFWWDNWTEMGPLAQLCPNFITRSTNKKKVKDFISNNIWDVQRLYNTLPSPVALHISSIKLGQCNKSDYAIWKATEDGHFSNGSAWHTIRKHKVTNAAIGTIWHKSIPFKQFFMCWRIYYGRVPLYKGLNISDSQNNADCLCCFVPKNETIQHVFAESN
ncbi:uncharacterized protein LOC132624543 [Lycium barbarum]|uniref:uncharacterized protein LOC132624543 n=1 Tax=Lycium barbarum TaxID=112863 RepID=UPI00293EBF52|nr:uncharacterized protein LOC132624543 [Lycium barbarum]